jgi:hypothetical protein
MDRKQTKGMTGEQQCCHPAPQTQPVPNCSFAW